MGVMDDILGSAAAGGVKGKPKSLGSAPAAFDVAIKGAPGAMSGVAPGGSGVGGEVKAADGVGAERRKLPVVSGAAVSADGSGGRAGLDSDGAVKSEIGRQVGSRLGEGLSGGKDLSKGKDSKRMSYVELYEIMNPNKPESEAERLKREKREKREAMFAAVGDGISALSNLYFTTRYAPNAYDGSKGLSARARERWDRLRKEREANDKAYFDGYLQAMAKDEAVEEAERNWQHTLEREKIADERYKKKAEQDKVLADLNEQLKRHQITGAEWEAERKRVLAETAAETESLKQENLRAGVRQKDAAAGASTAKAEYYRSGGKGGSGGGKGGSGGRVKHRFMGRDYASDKDYVKDVTEAARQYNERHKGEEGFVGIRMTGRKAEEFAGEVETRLAQEKESSGKKSKQPNPMGGEKANNGKKKNPMS